MQPQPPPITVDSVQNKELLWATLQESGAFAGLSRDQFQPVQVAFDRSVQQAARTMSGAGSLNEVNKHIIREFVQLLRSFSQGPTMQGPTMQQGLMQTPQIPTKKKKIELVYRAEDIQNERISEFDRQLREKQAEMDSYLTLKKPTDVTFTDTSAVDDKPIGDEMSRLIAQELAARERELVQLKPDDIKKAQQWIGTSANNVGAPLNNTSTVNPPSAKKVSFSTMMNTNIVEEEHETEHFHFNESNVEEESKFEETDSIFSKFKKISDPSSSDVVALPVASLPVATVTDASITIQKLYNKILELEQNINAKHNEIMARLNHI